MVFLQKKEKKRWNIFPLTNCKKLETKGEIKSFLFPWAPLAVIGTGQADDIGFFISVWIKASKQEQIPLLGPALRGSHARETRVWVDLLGQHFMDENQMCVDWERGYGMAGLFPVRECRDGIMAHVNSAGVLPLSWAWAPSHPRELSPPHSSPGCWNPIPLPLNYSQWWHMRLLSEIIISGALFSLLNLLLHQLFVCFFHWLPQDSLSLLVANLKKHQHFTTQTSHLWPDLHRVSFCQKSLVFYGLAPKRKQHTSQR